MRNNLLILSFFFFSCFHISLSQTVKPSFSNGHSAEVNALGFSPNGQFVVSAGGDGDGAIKLWETRTGRLIKTWNLAEELTGSRKYACDVAFLDEEHLLAAVNGRPLLQLPISEEADGKRDSFIQTGADPLPSVRAFRLHPKKKEILTLDEKGQLNLWNVKGLKVGTVFKMPNEKTTALGYSSDGQTIFTGTEKGNITSWDAKKGVPQKTLKTHRQKTLTLETDPATKSAWVLSGTESSLEYWNTETNKTIELENAYSPAQGSVFPLRPAAISPDGKWVAYGGIVQQPTLFVYDVENRKTMHRLVDSVNANLNRYIYAVSFSENSNMLAVGYGDGSIILWETLTGKIIHRLGRKPRQINEMGFTKDRKYTFVVHDLEKEISIYDGTNSKEYSLRGHKREIVTAAFSPDGKYLYSSAEDNSFYKWDFKTGKIIWEKTDLENKIKLMAFSPKNEYALTSSGGKNVELWDLKKQQFKNIGNHAHAINSLAFSEDGRYAMVSQYFDGIYIYDVENEFQLIKKITGQQDRFNNPVAFSPDGKFFLSVSCNNSNIELWSVEEKKEKDFNIKNLPIGCGANKKPVFSPDGKYFLTAALGGAYLWDIETGGYRFLEGGADDINTVDFTAEGRVAVAGGRDGSITLWRTDNGEKVATVYQLSDNNWVVITPDGLFDASANAFSKVYFVNNLETIDLEQLKDIYHEPGLLPIILGHQKGTLRKVVLEELDLYPEVDAYFKKDSILQIDLTERQGGIGKVSVFINGSEVIEDARSERNKTKCDPINIWDYEGHFFLTEEEVAQNVITIRAYNEGEWLKSPAIELYPFGSAGKGAAGGGYKGRQRTEDAGLYAIVIGTHDYKEAAGEKSIDLKYSAVDAHTMSEAIKVITDGYIKGPVEITELTTADPDVNKWPTKTAIKAAFDKVTQKSKAEDVLLLFLSGHGKTYSDDQHSDFYYLTPDCSSMNLAPPEVRQNFAIPTDTLTYWISQVPAKKRVIIMDACESGAGAQRFSASKSLTSSQKRELERLKDRNGMFVLASSESGQQSYEDWNRKQGLLTYSLMDGMVNSTDGKVSVLELFQHSVDLVPDLAKNIRAEQTPVMTIPSEKVESFTIGWVKDPSDIPLSGTSDLVAPCLFLDKAQMNDHLYLSNLIDEQLREGNAQGRLGEMSHTNNPQNENAYAVRGLYEVRNGMVFLEGRVFKNTSPQGAVFKVEFAENSTPQEKEQKIIGAVNGVLEGLE